MTEQRLTCKKCGSTFLFDALHECSPDKLIAENERMRAALNTIYWTLPATNPQSWAFKEIAKKGLYGE